VSPVSAPDGCVWVQTASALPAGAVTRHRSTGTRSLSHAHACTHAATHPRRTQTARTGEQRYSFHPGTWSGTQVRRAPPPSPAGCTWPVRASRADSVAVPFTAGAGPPLVQEVDPAMLAEAERQAAAVVSTAKIGLERPVATAKPPVTVLRPRALHGRPRTHAYLPCSRHPDRRRSSRGATSSRRRRPATPAPTSRWPRRWARGRTTSPCSERARRCSTAVMTTCRVSALPACAAAGLRGRTARSPGWARLTSGNRLPRRGGRGRRGRRRPWG
jgi:hypothetical protein